MGCMAPVMPDENARTAYAKQVVAEMTNPHHTLYTTAYNLRFQSLIPDMSSLDGNQIPKNRGRKAISGLFSMEEVYVILHVSPHLCSR